MSPTDDGDSETVQACPACDSSSVATNNIGGIQSVNPDADRYRCADCYETFDEPEERERPGIRSSVRTRSRRSSMLPSRTTVTTAGGPTPTDRDSWQPCLDGHTGRVRGVDRPLPSTFDLDDGFTETARRARSSSCWTRSVTRSIDH